MYIAFGNRVLDSNDIKNIIEENTEFKVIKDMSKGSKREDIVAFNLSLDIDTLNKEISETINISEEDEDTLFEEYMATTEELGFELEEYLPILKLFDREGENLFSDVTISSEYSVDGKEYIVNSQEEFLSLL